MKKDRYSAAYEWMHKKVKPFIHIEIIYDSDPLIFPWETKKHGKITQFTEGGFFDIQYNDKKEYEKQFVKECVKRIPLFIKLRKRSRKKK